MRPMDAEHVTLAEIDLSDRELWLAPRDHRERVFRTLRDEAPVQFFEEVEFPPFAKGAGYFAVTRYEDVWMASRNPQLFCSGQGTVIPDMPIEIAEFFGSMISMDDPRHYRLRSLVAKAFTPKVVSQIEGYVREKADGIVDSMLEKHPDGACDIVADLAAPLPLQIICEMMGIPDEESARSSRWTNIILGDEIPTPDSDLWAPSSEPGQNSSPPAVGEDRLANPRDDLTSP